MKKIGLFILIVIFIILYPFTVAVAQDCDCYTSTRAKGVQLMQQKQYSRAIEYFKAAEDCPDMPPSNDLRAKRDECLRAIREIEETRKREAELARKKALESSASSKAYMDIIDIQFANEDADNNVINAYGSLLSASEMRYLHAKILYNGLASENKTVKLFWKLFKPDGSMCQVANSPDGYTYYNENTVYPVKDQSFYLSGYGNKNGGLFPAGVYRYEIWYNDTKLFSKNFEINDASKGHSYIKVTNILLGNADYDRNILTDYGKPLYSSEMRYLQPRVFYNGLSNEKKQVKLYWKIIKPDGTISRGSTSPEGFTSTSEYTIYSGTNNTLDLLGWGNKDGGTYPAGLYKYELWCEGNLLFSKEFAIKGKPGEVSYLKVDNKTAVSTIFTANGGTETFYISTDSDSWTTWGIPTWCSVEDKTSNSFKLKCESNTSSSERSDYMKIKAGDKEVRIDVKQSGSITGISRTANIESVTAEHNVYKDNIKGMKIHVKFDVQNCKSESCGCLAYFYYENGNKLENKSISDTYKTSDGHICVVTEFTPGYDNTTYSDLVLFIPNYVLTDSATTGAKSFYFSVRLYNFSSKNFIDNKSYKVTYSLN